MNLINVKLIDTTTNTIRCTLIRGKQKEISHTEMCAGMLAASRSWAGQRMNCLMASGESSALLTLWFRYYLWIFGSGNTREFISVIASHCVCGNLLL